MNCKQQKLVSFRTGIHAGNCWNNEFSIFHTTPWWRHQIETFSALLAIYAENSPVTGKFPSQKPVTRSFDIFIDLRLNKPLSKQSWGWWFETLSRPLWRHCYVVTYKGRVSVMGHL